MATGQMDMCKADWVINPYRGLFWVEYVWPITRFVRLPFYVNSFEFQTCFTPLGCRIKAFFFMAQKNHILLKASSVLILAKYVCHKK